VWDALFWRFIHVHRNMFANNPRMSMMVRQLEKMPQQKLQMQLAVADKFLKTM